MVSRKEDKVDFNKLERELTDAVEADQRYWRENDAKFRAVHQKVATYDEFRDIVLASHLKPLEKCDNIGQCFKQTWNVNASKADDCATSDTQEMEIKGDKLPSNSHEFSRVWKNKVTTFSDRYNFLHRIGSRRLGQIFRTEISFGLLGEIIVALNSNYRDEDCSAVVEMLEMLSRTNRFSLSLQFLGPAECSACSQLLQRLHNTCITSADQQCIDSINNLLTVYNT